MASKVSQIIEKEMRTRESMGGPQFLGIGAPRCGTTWLQQVLRLHPDIWLPPIKEVHFFDSLKWESTSEVKSSKWTDRVRKHLVSRIGHSVSPLLGAMPYRPFVIPRVDFEWDRKYFSTGVGIDWYKELFRPKREKYRMVGEITPSYISISAESIDLIRVKTDVSKFIVLLRDPIESAWSGYGRKVREGKIERSTVDENEIVRLLTQGIGLENRKYARNLKRWFSIFPKSSFFVGFFEDLSNDPGRMLDEICAFLEVSAPPNAALVKAAESINSSRLDRGTMSRKIEAGLARAFEPDLRELAMMLGGPPTHWHRRAERILSSIE